MRYCCFSLPLGTVCHAKFLYFRNLFRMKLIL
uniref:Protein PHYLLOic n=1 Tax=Rhizophora mucronata TaxID=61149 RepID=A0A2P2MWG8_RHIMU